MNYPEAVRMTVKRSNGKSVLIARLPPGSSKSVNVHLALQVNSENKDQNPSDPSFWS